MRPTTNARPTRYLDRLREQLNIGLRTISQAKPEDRKRLVRGWSDRDLNNWVNAYRIYLSFLDDPETKRIVFDSRQAKLFDDLEEIVPSNMQGKLHPPFRRFYMEFTEPITIGEPDPNFEGTDFLRALLFEESFVNLKIPWQPPDGSPVQEQDWGDLSQLVFFFQDSEGGLVDRAFYFQLQYGASFTRVINALNTGDPSEIPWENPDPNGYIPCGFPLIEAGPDRYIGWWERLCIDYGSLFSWILAYMMAKSIVVQQEPVSRQQRRWSERKNKPLHPWHIVKVEPKFSSGGDTEQNEGSRHRYRYDVIGHLRFGKHKRGDGTYSETIEWVPPHQRGLANDIYIPKTYKVERGKIIAPAMRQYYGEEKKKDE